MEVVNIHKAKSSLSALIERVLKGESIIIAKNGKPLVKLEKVKTEKHKRVGGQLKGQIKIAENFDVLPAEFMKHFQ